MLRHSTSCIRSALVAGLCVAGCAGPQSTLAPAGDAARAIAGIWWVMLSGATVLFVFVMALLTYVLVRRGRGPQLSRPSRFIVAGGLLMPTFVLAALLVYGVLASRQVTGMDVPVERVIAVTGHRWYWQFDYLDEEGSVVGGSTDLLVIPARRMIEFRVTSADVIHGFWIPRLGGKIDAIPGRVNTLRLRADSDREGPMRGQCAEFCGLDHAHMTFEVRVVDDAAFERWLEAGAATAVPIPEDSDE